MASPSELQQFWQQTVSEWQMSGLSGAAFCKQRSLTYHQFVYWRRKREGGTERRAADETPPGFTRVALAAPPAASVDGLTVSLPGGVSITGLDAGNVALLGAILRQL